MSALIFWASFQGQYCWHPSKWFDRSFPGDLRLTIGNRLPTRTTRIELRLTSVPLKSWVLRLDIQSLAPLGPTMLLTAVTRESISIAESLIWRTSYST